MILHEASITVQLIARWALSVIKWQKKLANTYFM